MSDRYAVFGNPVGHSKSPLIHTSFAEATRQDLVYTAELIERGDFDEAVVHFFAGGGKGLNVTVPFKEEAWDIAAVLSDDARIAGAVNTLKLDDNGQIEGHNTDGIGLVRDICHNHSGQLRDKRLLVLGAGGASRGILLPFLREQPASITIANRTVSRAGALAGGFSEYGSVVACGFEDLAGEQFDWVINATSASLKGELPPLPDTLLAPDACCYDLMYTDEPTAFCRWASEHGAAKSINGLGMLVEQAAESFWLWRGMRPETEAVLKMLRV